MKLSRHLPWNCHRLRSQVPKSCFDMIYLSISIYRLAPLLETVQKPTPDRAHLKGARAYPAQEETEGPAGGGELGPCVSYRLTQ